MKITIDFENTSKEYGFKNAEEFFNEFKKIRSEVRFALKQEEGQQE